MFPLRKRSSYKTKNLFSRYAATFKFSLRRNFGMLQLFIAAKGNQIPRKPKHEWFGLQKFLLCDSEPQAGTVTFQTAGPIKYIQDISSSVQYSAF